MLAQNPAAGRCQGVGVAFPGMLNRSGAVVVHAPALVGVPILGAQARA